MATNPRQRRRRRQQETSRRKRVSYRLDAYRAGRRPSLNSAANKKSTRSLRRVLALPKKKSRDVSRSLLNKSATFQKMAKAKKQLQKWGGCKPRPDSRRAGRSPKRGKGAGPRKYLPWCN